VNATKLGEGDKLIYAGIITDQKYAILISRNGFVLKFPLEQISEMKKTAAGMQGMKLGKDDLVEKALMIREKETEPLQYRDAEIDLSKMRTSQRNGKGTKRF
jgi:DNA gyrase subunit A